MKQQKEARQQKEAKQQKEARRKKEDRWQKVRKQPQGQIRNLLIFALVLMVVGMGIVLPARVLAIQAGQEYNQISNVPEEYLSSSSAMAKSASSNLKTVERLQLIMGQWESNGEAAKSYEMEQEDYEAVTLAREGMKLLYDSGQYPVNLSSEYSNWYSWTAEAYKSVDTTFHTYTAYYWHIHLKKYDGTEEHTIWMLDDGTIFFAESDMEEIDVTRLKDSADVLSEEEEDSYVITALEPNGNIISERLTYEGVNTDGLTWKALTQIEEGNDIYYVLQLYDENRYLYVIAP